MQPGQVDLLVAIVAYKTILSTPRKGVCTSYISRLSLGTSPPLVLLYSPIKII